MQLTKKQIEAYIELHRAIADTVRELKQIPSGHLYARLMSVLSFEQFDKIVTTLCNSGVIRKENDLLIWNI